MNESISDGDNDSDKEQQHANGINDKVKLI